MIAQPLQARLQAHNIPVNSPGWQMAEAAHLLPPIPTSADAFGEAPQLAAQKLMKAFYNYGRAHFTWISSSPPTAAAPGLLTGAATSCACATFNLNLKYLLDACGVPNVTMSNMTKRFITQPGLDCIDSKWKGNVATSNKTSAEFKAFVFSQHYWLSCGGQSLDVCYDRTFSGQVEWLTLLPAGAKELATAKVTADKLFKLSQPLPYADYALRLNDTGSRGWPLWKLIPVSELGARHAAL